MESALLDDPVNHHFPGQNVGVTFHASITISQYGSRRQEACGTLTVANLIGRSQPL
jgi:hypothetical protein